LLKNEEEVHQEVPSIQFKKVLYWIVIILSGYLLYYLSLGLWSVIHYIVNSGFQLEAVFTGLVWFPAVIFGWIMISSGWYISPTYFSLITTLLWEIGWFGGLWLIYRKKENLPDAKLAIGTILFFLSAIIVVVFGKEFFGLYTSFLMLLHLDPLIYTGAVDRIGFYWLLPLWLLSWSFFWLKIFPQFNSEEKLLHKKSFLLWVAWFLLLHLILWIYTIPYFNLSSW